MKDDGKPIPHFLKSKSARVRDCAARWAEEAEGFAERDPVECELREEVSAELRACFKSDTATELKRKEEHASYLRDSFSGKCEDWLQWPTDEQKEKALDEIYHALRLPPEDALLRVQLIVSGLIADAATGHTDACQRNATL